MAGANFEQLSDEEKEDIIKIGSLNFLKIWQILHL